MPEAARGVFQQAPKVMSGDIAAAKLEHLLSLERYLPNDECQSRLKKWRQS